MPAPTVSILIPAFNAAPWIDPCVRSALAQTHAPLEVLVWEDASTDGTARLLDAFGDRIHIVGREKLGGNPARNRLLAAARGDWVQFLDADDALLPDKVALQFAETPDLAAADVIYSPSVDEYWEGTTRLLTSAPSTVDPQRDLYEQWFLWQLSQANTALWRRTALVALGGWAGAQPCCQDNELYSRALRAGLRFSFAPSARAIHRTWSEQTVSHRDPLQVVREKTRLLDEMCDWLRARGLLRPAHLAAAGQAAFELARTWARHDLPAAAAYVAERRARTGVLPRGPAAPLSYRVAFNLFGFRGAELLARGLR